MSQTEPKGDLTRRDAAGSLPGYVYVPMYQLTDEYNADQHKITYMYNDVDNATKVVDRTERHGGPPTTRRSTPTTSTTGSFEVQGRRRPRDKVAFDLNGSHLPD